MMVTNLKLFIFKFYPEEPEVSKENMDKREVSFSDLGIEVRDGKFKVGLPDKRDSFIFLMLKCQRNRVKHDLTFYAIFVKPYETARASNHPESFLTALKPLVTCGRRQAVSNEETNRIVLKIL